MLSKKVIPLIGISVLLLLVNLPQADADLCGDTVFLDVVLGAAPGGTPIFSDSGIVTLNSAFSVVPGVTVSATIFCDGGAGDPPNDGVSLIFFDYFNSNTVPTPVPEHSFWYTDLQWTDAAGKVVDFQVFGNLMATGFTDTSVHAIFPAQTIPPGNLLFNDLIITATHPVGGELIPLDTTMVLVAGTQLTAAWMIPAIVAAIGIGIVIARKF